ncbi:MAG: hypothetical protein ABH834_02415, partial [Candidatus Altiarchaeota archaeon]
VTGRPRFEGLDALAMRPVPDQVKLYSDGVLVLTVLNTRPYSVQMDYVEVAPIADRNDVVRTNLNEVLRTNKLGFFEVNASNLLSSVYEASLLSLPEAVAGDSRVSFHIRFVESYLVGGKASSHTAEGKGINIPYMDAPSVDGDPCSLSPPGWTIPCGSGADCPLVCHWCSGGGPEGLCGDECGNDPANCNPEAGPGEVCKCVATEANPLGTCMACPSS